MNADEVKIAVNIALAACPTAASFLDAVTIRGMRAAWLMVLEDLPADEVNAALKRYLATTPDKLPSPGRLRQIADEARHGRRRAGGEAWGDVLALLRPTLARPAFSAHRPPAECDLADPIAWRALCAITWGAICAAEVGDASVRSQFVRLYDALEAGHVEDRSVASLPGVARPALPSGEDPRIEVTRIVGDVAKLLTGGAP